jgi:hypothetical protein
VFGALDPLAQEAGARVGLSWKQLAEREGPGTATGPNATVAPTLAVAPSTAAQRQHRPGHYAAPSAAPAALRAVPAARLSVRQQAAAPSAALARPVGRAGSLFEKLRASKSLGGGAR